MGMGKHPLDPTPSELTVSVFAAVAVLQLGKDQSEPENMVQRGMGGPWLRQAWEWADILRIPLPNGHAVLFILIVHILILDSACLCRRW